MTGRYTKKGRCDRCGQEVYRRDLQVEDLYEFDISSKEAFIDSVMRLNGVAEEVAMSWAEHGLYEECGKAMRNCPECDSPLKTWRAKICLSCGASFTPWTEVETHNNTLKSRTPKGAA